MTSPASTPVPVTRVVVWDHRLLIVGQTANAAAAIAIATALQTAVAIGRALRVIERAQRTKTEQGEPMHDVVFREHKRSRGVVAGIVASFAGIAQSSEGDAPGSVLTVSDQRKEANAGIAP